MVYHDPILWSGTDKELRQLERIIVDFLWEGHVFAKHIVDLLMFEKPKSQGVVGIISFCQQERCLETKKILFVVGEGSHPLQIIIRDCFKLLSKKKWGTNDLASVFSKYLTLPSSASN